MLKCLSYKKLERSQAKQSSLAKAMAEGFTAAELTLSQKDMTENNLCSHYLDRLATCGLSLVAITSSQWDLFDLASNEEKAERHFVDLLGFAAEIESRPLVVIPAHLNHAINEKLKVCYEDEFYRLFTTLERLTRIAETKYIMLALENPAGIMLQSPLEFRELVDELKSSRVGVCLNAQYAEQLGRAVDWLKMMDCRVVATRVQNGKNDDLLKQYQKQELKGPVIYDVY